MTPLERDRLEFAKWWDALPDGWPATRPYRDLLERAWLAARGYTVGPPGSEIA